jgi:hypothetical protein
MTLRLRSLQPSILGPRITSFELRVTRNPSTGFRRERPHVAAHHESGDVVSPDGCPQPLYRLILLARFPPGRTARAADVGGNTRLVSVQVSAFATAPFFVVEHWLRLRCVAIGRAQAARERGRGGARPGPCALGNPIQTCRGSSGATGSRLLGLGDRERDRALGLLSRSVCSSRSPPRSAIPTVSITDSRERSRAPPEDGAHMADDRRRAYDPLGPSAGAAPHSLDPPLIVCHRSEAQREAPAGSSPWRASC